MIEIEGRYTKAIVLANDIDEETTSQIFTLVNQRFTQDSKIVIMPDCHAGAGCVIGTTMTITKQVVPNLVGVDIGCGMLTICLGKIDIDFEALDNFIRANIPSGREVHNRSQKVKAPIEKLHIFSGKPGSRHYASLGTLGGGNHFIEVDVDEENNKYLIIHSGSRNLGKMIAEHYQKKAVNYCRSFTLKPHYTDTFELPPQDLCYLEGSLLDDYLHDMKIAQEFALENRDKMGELIVKHLGVKPVQSFHTVHNYIDFEDMILRKGAIKALKDELVIIPINMRDGCILAKGKGNPEYNCSAPHGAGRILSRSEAKNQIALEDYINSMEGIYTSSVSLATLDESPFAYKPIEVIIENIQELVTIVAIIKPIYNFKA